MQAGTQPGPAVGGPLTFRWIRWTTGGFGGVALQTNGDASLTITGRTPDRHVRRQLFIGDWITAIVFAVVVVLGFGWWFQNSGVLQQAAGSTNPVEIAVIPLAIIAAAVLIRLGFQTWLLVVAYSTRPGQTTVRMSDIHGVRARLNYSMLWWILLIGPFALIPLFMGRRYLRFELPPPADASAPARRLRIKELSLGDAKLMETWLREGGAS